MSAFIDHLLCAYHYWQIFKDIVNMKEYLKIAYKSEPCNNVYLSYFCFYRFIKVRLKVHYSATILKKMVLILQCVNYKSSLPTDFTHTF